MAATDPIDRPLLAHPGDDPYEIEWPDDTKELRDAELARKEALAAIVPAPRFLTAAVLGLGIVVLFLLPVALASTQPSIFTAFFAPLAIAGLVLGGPVLLLLDRINSRLPRAIPELLHLVLGFAVGAIWTWVIITNFQDQLFDEDGQLNVVRQIATIFVGSMGATAFLTVFLYVDKARLKRKAIFLSAILLLVALVMSIVANVT